MQSYAPNRLSGARLVLEVVWVMKADHLGQSWNLSTAVDPRFHPGRFAIGREVCLSDSSEL